jgi:hypothetical protein
MDEISPANPTDLEREMWRRVRSRTARIASYIATTFRPVVATRSWKGWQWFRLNIRIVLWVVGIGITAVLLIILATHWTKYEEHHAALAPIFTLAAGLAVAGVTLMRHFAQTDAERQRRVTESFSKAIEQLGSDRLEVRLGGIYALERISKESLSDYWTVIECLTAFVRERSLKYESDRKSVDYDERVSRCAYFAWVEAGKPEGQAERFWQQAVVEELLGAPPAADIAAILTVVNRRSEQSRRMEKVNGWQLNFSGAFLKRAWQLRGAHLEGAIFIDTNLDNASLVDAHLEGAFFSRASLQRATLINAHLNGAELLGADLSWARLTGAHFEGVFLNGTKGLTAEQISSAFGDRWTSLPVDRPANWPPQTTWPQAPFDPEETWPWRPGGRASPNIWAPRTPATWWR